MQVGHIRENGYEGVYFEDDEGNTLGIERRADIKFSPTVFIVSAGYSF